MLAKSLGTHLRKADCCRPAGSNPCQGGCKVHIVTECVIDKAVTFLFVKLIDVFIALDSLREANLGLKDSLEHFRGSDNLPENNIFLKPITFWLCSYDPILFTRKSGRRTG